TAPDSSFRAGSTKFGLPSAPSFIANLPAPAPLPHTNDLGPVVNPLTRWCCGGSSPGGSLPRPDLTRGSYLPEKALKDTDHPRRIGCGGGVFQKPVPDNSRVGFRHEQPAVEPLIRVDLPPVWHSSIQLAIDRHLGRPADLIAELRVLIVQLLQLG